jgi:hypothetical protein
MTGLPSHADRVQPLPLVAHAAIYASSVSPSGARQTRTPAFALTWVVVGRFTVAKVAIVDSLTRRELIAYKSVRRPQECLYVDAPSGQRVARILCRTRTDCERARMWLLDAHKVTSSARTSPSNCGR